MRESSVQISLLFLKQGDILTHTDNCLLYIPLTSMIWNSHSLFSYEVSFGLCRNKTTTHMNDSVNPIHHMQP